MSMFTYFLVRFQQYTMISQVIYHPFHVFVTNPHYFFVQFGTLEQMRKRTFSEGVCDMKQLKRARLDKKASTVETSPPMSPLPTTPPEWRIPDWFKNCSPPTYSPPSPCDPPIPDSHPEQIYQRYMSSSPSLKSTQSMSPVLLSLFRTCGIDKR